MKLVKDEIDLIVNALDAWVNKDDSSMIMGGLMATMMMDDKDKAEKLIKQKESEESAKKHIRMIAATKLKAKFYLHMEEEELSKAFTKA